jgi:hypothetical protein
LRVEKTAHSGSQAVTFIRNCPTLGHFFYVWSIHIKEIKKAKSGGFGLDPELLQPFFMNNYQI